MKKNCTLFIFAILLFSFNTNITAQVSDKNSLQPTDPAQSPKTASGAAPEFMELNNLAMKKAMNDEFEEASKLFVRSLELNPSCNVCRYNLGWVMLHLGRYDSAIEISEALLKNDPKDHKTAAVLGVAYIKKERYAESISYLKQAIAAKPNADLFAKLGYAYLKLNNLKDSIKSFDESVKLDPKGAEVLNNRGYLLYLLGRSREAIESLSIAVQLAPSRAEIQNNLGVVYESMGKGKKAAESYQKAIELNPDYADARFNLGLLYLKENNRQGAYTELWKLEKFDSSTADKLREALQQKFVINVLKP